jgi:hypothetical protein
VRFPQLNGRAQFRRTKEVLMARLFVCDREASISAEVEVAGSLLSEALEHEQAEPVVRCAMLMALSTLAQGEPWPSAALQAMAAFMALMKEQIVAEPLM